MSPLSDGQITGAQALSPKDRDALLVVVDLYRDWGIDCTIDCVPHNRLDRVEPLPLTRERAKSRPGRRETSPQTDSAQTNPGQRQPPLDQEAARLWGVSTFPDCALSHTASRIVRPAPVPGARIMLIGDAPNAEEDRSGTVFAGETGHLLDTILSSIGLSRPALSQAPALPWRPPGGRAVSQIEFQNLRPLLHAAIALAQPERLLLFGQTPLRLLLDERGTVARSRGKWHDVRLDNGVSCPALVMQHPQQLLSSARARREMWKDLLFLAETLDSPS